MVAFGSAEPVDDVLPEPADEAFSEPEPSRRR